MHTSSCCIFEYEQTNANFSTFCLRIPYVIRFQCSSVHTHKITLNGIWTVCANLREYPYTTFADFSLQIPYVIRSKHKRINRDLFKTQKRPPYHPHATPPLHWGGGGEPAKRSCWGAKKEAFSAKETLDIHGFGDSPVLPLLPVPASLFQWFLPTPHTRRSR